MNRMLMVGLFVIGLLGTARLNQCMAEELQFEFKTPKRWRSERFLLPAKFAPQMKFKGVEELRFAPGMFQKSADDFLSYLFVFALEDQSEINQANLQTELTAYYQGLSASVLKNDPIDATTVKLEPVQKQQSFSQEWNDVTSYSGTVEWTEPFVTKNRQTLRITVDQFSVKGHPQKFVFICASPAQRDANIWKVLHQIRQEFAIKK